MRPAPEPAARDCRAPRDAMGFTEELLLEVGEEPVQGNRFVCVTPNKQRERKKECYVRARNAPNFTKCICCIKTQNPDYISHKLQHLMPPVEKRGQPEELLSRWLTLKTLHKHKHTHRYALPTHAHRYENLFFFKSFLVYLSL